MRLKARLGIVAAMCCVLFGAIGAEAGSSMSKAKRLYSKMEFVEAGPIFAEYATKGEAEAQYYLGLMSWYGLGGEQDYEAAKDLLVQALDQDFKPAMWGLAMFEQYGLDIDRSPQEAYAESQRLMQACGVDSDQEGVVKNKHANRFVNDSMVVMQAMATEMNTGNQLLGSERDEAIQHLYKAEDYLVVAKQSGPMFAHPCKLILFSLHNTYRQNNITPKHPELYEQTQRKMRTGAARAEDQRQQLMEKLKRKYGSQ